MAWEIVPRFAGLGTTKKTVTLFRDSRGWRLYLPSNVRKQLGDPKFVDLLVDDYKLKLKVPQNKEVYTRLLTNGAVRLPLLKLGIKMEEGMTRVDVLPEIKKNELVIDLGRYKSF